MNFEFVIACHITPTTDIEQTLIEVLSDALQNSQNDFDEDAITDMVHIRHRRPRIQNIGGGTSLYTLIGFSIELSEEMEALEQVIDDFAKALSDDAAILHVVKFEDQSLQDRLKGYADEIFAIEMKLRRVLSLIYLHAYQDEDRFYTFLEDERVNLTNKPNRQQMESAIENEFFHLTFSQYKGLNRRKVPTNVSDVISLIKNSDSYDALLKSLQFDDPITNQDDELLLNDIREGLLDNIEKMRNCVAHNRRPTLDVIENYPSTRDRLNKRLDDYLAEWRV